MPIWRTNCQIDTHQIHEVMEIKLIMTVPKHKVIVPTNATGRAPKRSSTLPPKKLRNALAERAGKHHQTANCSGIATAILNIQGHDHHNRAEREKRKRGRYRANSKTTILQHAQIQQRRLRFRIFDLPARAP